MRGRLYNTLDRWGALLDSLQQACRPHNRGVKKVLFDIRNVEMKWGCCVYHDLKRRIRDDGGIKGTINCNVLDNSEIQFIFRETRMCFPYRRSLLFGSYARDN